MNALTSVVLTALLALSIVNTAALVIVLEFIQEQTKKDKKL